MKYGDWIDLLDRSHTIKSPIVIHCSRGTNKITGSMPGFFMDGILINEQFIPRTMIIDVKESEVENEQT